VVREWVLLLGGFFWSKVDSARLCVDEAVVTQPMQGFEGNAESSTEDGVAPLEMVSSPVTIFLNAESCESIPSQKHLQDISDIRIQAAAPVSQ